MRKPRRALRAVASVAMFAWLGSMIDWPTLRATLAAADPVWLLVPHLLTLFTFFACVSRWRILLRSQAVDVSRRLATRSLFIGQFISNFLPSNVGGDVARAAFVTRKSNGERWPAIAGSVAVDRMTGLVAILFVLPVVGLLQRRWLEHLHLIVPLALACFGIAAVTLFVFSNRGAQLIAWCERLPLLGRPARVVAALHNEMLAYRSQPGAVARAILVSIAFYVAHGLQVWMLSFAFPGGPVAWSAPIVMFCAMSLVAMLPISVNGYGLQEGGYALLFASLGYARNAAIAIAVATRLLSLAVSVIGGVVFAISDLSPLELETTTPVPTVQVVEFQELE